MSQIYGTFVFNRSGNVDYSDSLVRKIGQLVVWYDIRRRRDSNKCEKYEQHARA